MRDNGSTTVLSAATGVVLLAALVAFAVLVPKIGDDEVGTDGEDHSYAAGQTDLEPVSLPDRLGDDLVAVDLGTLPETLAQQFGDPARLKTQEAGIADGLRDVFGVPGAFRVYAAEDATALAQLTVLDKEPGLFTPDALPVDPSVLGVTRAASELVDVDGAVCSVSWPEEVPQGQQVDPAVKPQGIRCQVGSGGRTWELTGQGLALDQAVTLLKGAASA